MEPGRRPRRLGRAVLYLAFAAVDRRDAVPDLPDLPVVVRAEAVKDLVKAPVDVLPGVGELRAIDLRQKLGYNATIGDIYVTPTVLCRLTVTREEIKIESATVERDGVRALCVFADEEDANDFRRTAHRPDESVKAIPVEDRHLRDLLEMHNFGHVVTPISFLGDDSVNLFSAEDFMRILEDGAPA